MRDIPSDLDIKRNCFWVKIFDLITHDHSFELSSTISAPLPAPTAYRHNLTMTTSNYTTIKIIGLSGPSSSGKSVCIISNHCGILAVNSNVSTQN